MGNLSEFTSIAYRKYFARTTHISLVDYKILCILSFIVSYIFATMKSKMAEYLRVNARLMVTSCLTEMA